MTSSITLTTTANGWTANDITSSYRIGVYTGGWWSTVLVGGLPLTFTAGLSWVSHLGCCLLVAPRLVDMGDDTMNALHLAGGVLVALPVLLVTWLLAWCNGRAKARVKAALITGLLGVAVVGCAIEPTYAGEPEPVRDPVPTYHKQCKAVAEAARTVAADRDQGGSLNVWLAAANTPQLVALVLGTWERDESPTLIFTTTYAGCLRDKGEWGHEL